MEVLPQRQRLQIRLGDREVLVTIESIKPEPIGDGDRKLVARFEGKSKGLVLNDTNLEVIEQAFGSDTDDAVGVMEKNAEGRLAITRVTLRQRLKFSGDKQPTPQEIEEMNHGAHEQCFIANSVKTEVKVEPQT